MGIMMVYIWLILIFGYQLICGVFCMEPPHSVDENGMATRAFYSHFMSRSSDVRLEIADHQAFMTFLRSFDPGNVDVSEHFQQINWLQRLLKGQEDWQSKSASDLETLWNLYARLGILSVPGNNFPFHMIFQSLTRASSFNAESETKYLSAFQKAMSMGDLTSCMGGTFLFLSNYMGKVYDRGQECRVRWFVRYPGYISGEYFEQGRIVDNAQAHHLLQARTDQCDAQAALLNILSDEGMEMSDVSSVLFKDPFTLRVRIVGGKSRGPENDTSDTTNDGEASTRVIQRFDDAMLTIQGAYQRYAHFDLMHGLACLEEGPVPTGYVHPMFHVQHPKPHIRWMAASCALDWLLRVEKDSLPMMPISLLMPENKLACMLMLYNQNVVA